jgi:hypothetical protein
MFNFLNQYRLKFDCEAIWHRRLTSTGQISPTAQVEGKRRLPRECQLQRHWSVMRDMNWPEMDPLRDVRLSHAFHMMAFMAQDDCNHREFGSVPGKLSMDPQDAKASEMAHPRSRNCLK